MKKKSSKPPGTVQKDGQDARPDPMELAKLAAILMPSSPPKQGLMNAIEYYVEAVLFMRELPADFDELLERHGSWREVSKHALLLADAANRQKGRDNALKLEPDKPDDEVRRFLDEKARLAGIIHKREHLLKSARSVLDNLRDYYESIPVTPWTAEFHLAPDQFIESLKQKADDGREFYLIPRDWLAGEVQVKDGDSFPCGLMEYKRNQASERAKKAAETKKENLVNKKPKNLQAKKAESGSA